MIIYSGAHSLFSHEYSKELKRLLQEDSEEVLMSDTHTHFSYRLDKTLNETGIGDLFEIINFLITLTFIIFYIFSTYTYTFPNQSAEFMNQNNQINTIEIYLCTFLIIHFCVKFYIAQSRLFFLFEFTTFIDYISVICIILAQQSFISDDLGYFLRLFRMIRILYLFKLEYILQKRYNETVRYSYKLMICLVSIICLSASLILELENWNSRTELKSDTPRVQREMSNKGKWKIFQFHDMIYYELVTLATIGFGDITPKTWYSRYVIIITIMAILVIVLPLYSKLKIIFALSSKYSRMSYQGTKQKTKHLLVLGECSVESFEAFLQELYHEDHVSINYDTVLMQSSPNEDLMKLANQLSFPNKICYLVGNSLVHKDLQRCYADTAICAVILANKLAKNPRDEDFSNIMKAFSFRKYSCIFGQGAESRICIQLLRPETKEIYFSSLINHNDDLNNRDQVICVEEIKLQLLGKSCLCPGITTIISSLITSQKPTIEYNQLISSKQNKWMSEYLEGIQLEIYVVTLKAELIHNMKFIEVVKMVYEIANITIIGIDVIIDDMKPFVCLSPYSYLLSPFDHLVYILADKQPDEKQINDLIKEHLELKQKGIVESNIEMVKLLRLKNPFWTKIGNHNNRYSNNKMPTENTVRKQESNDNNTNYYNNNNNNHNNINYSGNFQRKLDVFSNLKNNFLHTILPRTQHEAEFFLPDVLDHHIIICGIGRNLQNLIMPLRASSMKHQQYSIVIIDKIEHIPSEIWKEIQYYPDIYFIQGNPIKAKDLHKAGIKKAKAVIILSKTTTDVEQADMVDADTIFIYKAIKNETTTALIIAELVSVASIGFLSSSDDPLIQKQGYWLCEPFAVGEIYIGSMLDTLICQAFYNPYITDILQQLIMGSALNNFPIQLTKKLQEKKITQSTLYLLNISEQLQKFDKRNYNLRKKILFEELFLIFVSHNMIPIGINRNSSKIAYKSKYAKSYVYLCPRKEDEIDIEVDKIYVLACDELLSNEKNATSLVKKKNNTYQYTKASKLIDKSNELVLDLAQGMKKLLEVNSALFKKAYSVKKVINSTRYSIRSELSTLHDKIGDGDESNSEQIKSNSNSVDNSNLHHTSKDLSVDNNIN